MKTKQWQTSWMSCNQCEFMWCAVHPASCEYLECPYCRHINPAPYIDPVTGEVYTYKS